MRVLRDGCRAAMNALGVAGSRNAVILVDETVWCPNWDLMVNLRPEPAPQLAYVGGYLNPTTQEDFTFIGQGTDELPLGKLSKLSQHFAVTRADSNKQLYFLDMRPRAPKASDKTDKGKKKSSGSALSTYIASIEFNAKF